MSVLSVEKALLDVQRGGQNFLVNELWGAHKLFGRIFLSLYVMALFTIQCLNRRFATICEQDGLHAEILVNYLITDRFQSEAHFWLLYGIPLSNRILLYLKC